MRRKWTGRILSFLLTFVMLFQNIPMSVSAANHNDTKFLNFAYDANGIIAGYVSEIDGQSDFTVEDGCVVLQGGVSSKTIRIKIQMDANYYYTYCICRPGYTMDQYNKYGVEFDGDSGKWTASYDKYNGFAYNASTEITLNYNDYNGSPLYGKRTAKIWISRLEENGHVANSYNQYYSLPLVFVVPADSVSASASISWENKSTSWEYPIDSGDGKALKANWNLAGNTGISASYQWYQKVGDTYTKIDGATGQTYVPTEIGTYKVDVALTVDSITAGVPKGSTYTASAEKTITKADPAVQVGWEYSSGNFTQNKTVTLKDAVSMQLYSKAAGKIVVKKSGSVVREENISTGYSTLDLGEASLAMAGAYSWEFTPNNTAFCNGVSGSGMNLTVNKLASGTSASMSSYISTSDYKGSISMKADVPGTFTFETGGRSQKVSYTTAGTSYTWTDLSNLIPQGTAAGSYTMNYQFTPSNAADYKEESGSMAYTVDTAKCDIVIRQQEGGTVKVNNTMKDFRGSVGETYTITVKPVAGSSSTNSSVKSVTVNGKALEESAMTRNSDGSVTVSYTIPEDGTNQTYTISAEYHYQKLVLKNNEKYYHDTIDILGMGVGLSLAEAEKAILDTVLDTGSSRGISYDGTVDIVYYQGIQKEIMTGEETECWGNVNAYVFGGGFLGDYRHTFGTETTEKIRVSIRGTSMSAETTIRIIKRTATRVNAQNAVAVCYDSDGAVMQNAMIEALGASVSGYVNDSLQEIAGAELSYTDTAGNAIDWSKVQGGDTISVKISYAGTKTDNGGYSSSNKTVSVYVRPESGVKAVVKTYNGSELFWETADFTPADTAVTVTVQGIEGYYDSSKKPITAPVHAGSYYVKLKLEDSYGSYISGYVPITVEPAELTVFGLTAENRIYDGTGTVKITGAKLSGIIENDVVQVDLSNSSATVSSKNVGTYEKVKPDGITFTGASAGDYKIAEAVKNEEIALTTSVTISAKEVTITGTSVASSKEYDGNKEAKITNAGTVSGKAAESDVVTVCKGTAAYNDEKVGKDKIVTFSGFSLAGADAANYELIGQPNSVKAEIKAKELEISAEVENRQYNGQMRTTKVVSAELTNLVGEDQVTLDISGASAVFTGIGNADTPTTVKASIRGITIQGEDAGNYHLSQPFEVDGTIVTDYTAKKDTDYYVNSNDWINTEFVVAGTDGYLLSETAAADGEWKKSLESNITDTDGKGSLSFYVKAPNGDISQKVTENYKIDTAVPTGTLEIGESSWKSFLNQATLGLFFNKTYELKVTAEDQENLSGVKSIEYFEYMVPAGGKGFSLNENGQLPVEESTWKTYRSPVSVHWNEETTYVYYVRITDHAGNVTYLCSHEGMEYDVTAPVIHGVEDQKSYYTTRKISAEDRNLDQVTVNETSVDLPHALEGNQDKVYTVTAKDKAGNSLTYTVTMKSISSLEDQLGDTTKENVTSEDKDLIDKVYSTVEAEDTDDATPEEKDALKKILQKCDELNEHLDEVQKTLKKGTELTTPVTKDNLEKDHKENLKNGQKILEELLKENEDNFTQEEIDQINKELGRVEALLGHIEAAEDVLDHIEKLPDSIQVDDEDGKTEDAILAAKKAYDALEDVEKSMVDEEWRQKLEGLLKALTDYCIIEGADQEWRRKTDEILVFRANGPLRKFKSVEIDGTVVDRNNYEVRVGSTIVTLTEHYRATLSIGEHTFQIKYSDGSTEPVKFRILAPHSTENAGNDETNASLSGDVKAADTGDTSNIGLWLTLLVSGAAVLLLMKRKRR